MADAANEFAGHGSTAYLRMARSAAIAGLVFSVLFVIVLVLFRSAFPIDQLIDSTSIPTSDRIERGRWALYLMPFVGIAFIWFMVAVFCLAVSTFSRMRRMLPSWLSILGTVTGIFLLLVPLGLRYVEYVFPVWVTILSVYLLIKDHGGTRRPNQNEVTA